MLKNLNLIPSHYISIINLVAAPFFIVFSEFDYVS